MLDAYSIVTSFAPWQGEAESDSYRDWLGVRTRMRYMPPPYMALAGTVQGMPGHDRAGLHDVTEWAGVLQSVIDAGESFTCVELGAGYGPFVVGSAVAARRRGIKTIRLVAIEGDQTHVEWMHEHFRDNGFDPADHRLVCAVAGTYDGVAQFPRLGDPSMEWGAEPIFSHHDQAGRTPQRTVGDFVELPCLSLTDILADFAFVDVVHFDIQGAELDVIRGGLDALGQKVRRIVIGTHGRDLEQQLMQLLDQRGWELELDKACSFQQQPPHGLTLLQDGVQVWRNRMAAINGLAFEGCTVFSNSSDGIALDDETGVTA